MAALLSTLETPLGSAVTPDSLETFGYAWVADVAELGTLSHWEGEQDGTRRAFERMVREFRQARPWLSRDVEPDAGEAFDYRHPVDGTVRYYVYRRSPDGDEEVLFAGNMEGAPVDVSVGSIAEELPPVPPEGWDVTLVPPDVEAAPDGNGYHLHNARAVVWTGES